MSFKEKIIAAFKLKYPTVNLSKKRLDSIATRIEAKVIDDEAKIDAALAAMDEAYPFAEIAKDDDKIRTLVAKVKPPKKDEPTETPEQKTARELEEAKAAADADKDTPAWAKTIIDSHKKLSEDLAAIKGEKVASTIRTKAAEKLKEIPESFWAKRAIPEKEEDVEAFVTDVTTDYNAFKQDMTNQGLNVLAKPKSAGGGADAGDAKKASKEEVDAVVKDIM